MDHFKTLGLPRRLVLAGEDIVAACDEGRRSLHPDAGGEAEAFRRLQEAGAVLRSPGRRLRHWLELEVGEFASRGAAPAEVMDLFGAVSALLERLDALARKKRAAKSELGRSLAERDGVRILAEVEALQDRVRRLEEDYTGRFASFESAGAERGRQEAEPVARGLLFLEKWNGELREAAFRLVHGE